MCFSVRQDHFGYIWISTKLGADRFDGKEFTHYPLPESQKPGYDPIGVNYLCQSPDGRLRAFSESGLLFRYNEGTDRFDILYSVRDFFNNPSIILYHILFESDHTIWLATSRGVLILDTLQGEAHLLPETEDLAVNSLNRHRDHYYLSTHTGLYLFEHTEHTSPRLVSHILPDKVVLTAFPDTIHQQVVIGTLDSGLYVSGFDGDGPAVCLSPDIQGPIRDIVLYDEERIAVGVDLEGVYVLDRRTLRVEIHHTYNENNPSDICSNNVRGLFVDNESNLWVATYHEGVSFQDSSKLNFNWFTHRVGDTGSIADNVVNAVLEDSSGDLWFGTNNGVSHLNRKTGQWRHYFSKSSPREKGDVILTLCEDSRGRIWAGGYAFGAACIDRSTGRYEHYTAGKSTSILATNYIYSICSDRDRLWFGGIMGDVTSYDIRSGKVTTYQVSKVNCFARLSDAYLLMGLFNGLFILNKETGEIRPTRFTKTVTSLQRIEDGRYWIGIKNVGLHYYDMDTDSVRCYSTQEGLSSDYIYAALPEDNGQLWVSTEYGLNKLNPSTGWIESFDTQDGLPSNQFCASAAYRCRDGQMLFGTPDGAILFHPEEIRKAENSHPYEIWIHRFDLFNEPVYTDQPGSVLTNPIYYTERIRLAHNRNFFSFRFTTPNFQSPHKTLYSYYLEGHDLNWSPPTPIDRVSYSRVPPGQYTFRVRPLVDGRAQPEKSIRILIDKPWWASYPAYIAYSLLLLIVLAYIYHLIQKRQEKRATESKIDFFITTAHDLLTPLNLIQAPLRDMQQELPADGKTGQLLDMALSHSSKLTHYVEKLLDFQRISLHASRLVVSAQSLESFLRYRIDSFRLVAGHKFITVECRFDESARQEIWFDKEKISRILDNLLSNAIKYTPYGGSIYIEASADTHKWYLRVRDSGIGISGRDQRMIFRHVFRAANAINSGEIGSGIGLKLVASLVNLHRGKISLRSKLGEGTEFFLFFPMYYEEAVRHTEAEQVASQLPAGTEGEPYIHRILIVEDDPEMSRYLMMSLRDQYQVKTCANGREALEETDRFCPHLILSDLLMPEMTGIELCRRVKGNVKSSHIPVLLLTGVTETESMREGMRAGAIDYIRKPFDKEVLKGKLENIFELQRTAQRQCLEKLKNDNALELSNKTDNEFMEKLLALIEKHIDNPELNISLLCSELALSRTLLYNKITQLTGNAPTEFIRMIRLKRAANLLLSGKHSVTEVAFQVGIDNPKYFSRVFKEFYGVSPREYLARSRKE